MIFLQFTYIPFF